MTTTTFGFSSMSAMSMLGFGAILPEGERMATMRRPAVLVVTGAYYPEISGGGLQAREVIRALRDRVDFAVLTTSSCTNETVCVDGVASRWASGSG